MRRSGRGEAGETLLEVLISVTILGLGVVALLGGMTTAVATTRVHRQQADVGAVLTAASEKVKSADYRACAVEGDYLGNPFTYPGWTGTITFAIAEWNGTAFVPRDPAAPAPLPCRQYEDLGHRVQRITLSAASPDATVTRTVTVLKRYRDCPIPTSTVPGCD